jgi:hypothetical protein
MGEAQPAIFKSQVTHFSWVCTASRSGTQPPKPLSFAKLAELGR